MTGRTEFTIEAAQINHPGSSLAYPGDYYIEVAAWRLLGFESWEGERDWMMAFENEEIAECERGSVLEDAVGEISAPAGWKSAGWEEHAHKDALGLVTLYFEPADGLDVPLSATA